MKKLQVLPGGGTRRSKAHSYHLMPPEGARNTADRFQAGAEIHGEFNWMKSCESEDNAFHFARSAYNHMMEHSIRMANGDHDKDPGGNLGAIGWAVYVLSYIEAKFGKPWTELRH